MDGEDPELARIKEYFDVDPCEFIESLVEDGEQVLMGK